MNGQQARRALAIFVTAAAIGAALVWYWSPRDQGLPTPDSPQYEELVRVFYRGLAALDAGLIDNAKSDFTRTTSLAPDEPAGWGNLGLAHLRLSEFDQAARAVTEAARRGPQYSGVALLQGLLEAARGNLDAAIGHLRRAAQLNPRDPRTQFALAEMLERAGASDADVTAALDSVLSLSPDNLAVRIERTRVAVRASDAPSFGESVRSLAPRAPQWSAVARQQYSRLERAAGRSDFADAAVSIAFLRNALARDPTFRKDLAAVKTPAELITEPFSAFLRLPAPSARPSPADTALSYSREAVDDGGPWTTLVADPADAGPPGAVFAANAREIRRVDASGTPTVGTPLRSFGEPVLLLPLDWNNDFKTDLLVADSHTAALFLQDADGTFVPGPAIEGVSVRAAWAADIDMDGDLDLILGLAEGDPVVLRNNGDRTWQTIRPFAGVPGARAFAWADVDSDGDPDALFSDASGHIHLFLNQQAGVFDRARAPALTGVRGLTVGDINADGVFDIVVLTQDGAIVRANAAGQGWTTQRIATWPDRVPADSSSAVRLLFADVDNNGALDLIGAGLGRSRIWLGTPSGGLLDPLAVDVEVLGVTHLNSDGLLDFAALDRGRAIRLLAHGQRPYRWQTIRPRARTAAGDQRINSFGVGGEIEIRAGALLERQILTGAPAHFGLGDHDRLDVARIVWPNGVAQVEFDTAINRDIVAEQRLKGSCPWLFSYDGTGMRFVTDVLWRSPLGLRINAQETAGVTQTEDWVKIGGDQLSPRDGVYDVRITAELWETHFFDRVSLMAVDHPANTEVFVDERFSREAPAFAVQATAPPRPILGAWDDAGHDVTELVKARDGRHLAGFEKGQYQGIAQEHYVELEIDPVSAAAGTTWLVARGWVQPTDSSINVAISQGSHPRPIGLSLDAKDGTGGWRTVHADLGFPAGKNKTMLIDLSSLPMAPGARRLRLRTNMEVYWDWLAVTTAVNIPVTETRIKPLRAELRYRGFSRTNEDERAHAPEMPQYERVANTAPRWRDLVGYHTRFGDVRPLLTDVDDRYVIMNAGDELRLAFGALPPSPTGWIRDFVFISDGWEKDGDFNTAFSKTVQPLPAHDNPEYRAPATADLEDEPVFRRHPDDWQRYHTRYVSPDRYLLGLRLR